MKKIMITISCLLMSLVLFACSSDNTNDAPVELRVEDGYIQYSNGDGWTNIISTEELKGEKGDKGDKGDPGTDGKNGVNGLNGKDGVDGTNGTDGKNGVDGKDGADGKDATVQNNITKEFDVSVNNLKTNSSSSDYGSIVVNSLNKAVVTGKSAGRDESNIRRYVFLMNEDGKIEVEAKAGEDWYFVEWSDGCTDAKRTITYNDETELEAYFTHDKEYLNYPILMSAEVDYTSKDLTLSWRGDEHASSYTVSLGDGLTFTSDTNSIKIPSSKLKKDSVYDIKVTANPKDKTKYLSTYSTYAQLNYYGSFETSTIPSYEKGAKVSDYQKTLKDAGFEYNVVEYIETSMKDYDGIIASVSPAPGEKARMHYTILIKAYKYEEHVWSETSRTEATCDKEGVINYSCSCGATKNEVIPKKTGDCTVTSTESSDSDESSSSKSNNTEPTTSE